MKNKKKGGGVININQENTDINVSKCYFYQNIAHVNIEIPYNYPRKKLPTIYHYKKY